MKVCKYPLQLTGNQLLHLPIGSRILTVQTQRGQPCLWAMVTEDAIAETREIIILATGHQIADQQLTYIATDQMDGGSLVFHVFERTPAQTFTGTA